MASSAKFLEEALSTDVDESAVSAIVGSLQNQLSTPSSTVSCQQVTSTAAVAPNQNYLHNSISNGSPSSNHHGTASNNISQTDIMNTILKTEPSKQIVSNQIANISQTVSNSNLQGVVSTSGFISQIPSNVAIVQTNDLNIAAGAVASKTSQDALKTVYASPSNGSRITHPATVQNVTSLPNGNLNLTPITANNILSTSNATSIQGMVSQTNSNSYHKITPVTGEQNKPPGTAAVIIKSTTCNNIVQSSAVPSQMTTAISLAGSPINTAVTLAKTTTAGGAQAILGNTPQTIQLVNFNTIRTTAPAQQGNKTSPAPRLMLPQVVGARPGQPQQITLQTLQGLQGAQGGHLLLKTENGQYQLLRVGPPPTSTATVGQNNTATLQGGFRLQTVPVCCVAPSSTPSTTVQTVTSQNQAQTAAAVPRANDNTREKCRRFLTNLLELSSREPKAVEKNVRTLIQELIDSKVEPEEFCDRLERLLNASPQPCLIGFLKKSLPLLRAAMIAKETTIDGIRPPPAPTQSPATVVLASPSTVVQAQIQNNQVRPTLTATGTRPQIQHRIITQPVRVQMAAGNMKVVTPTLPTVATAVRIPVSSAAASAADSTSVSSTVTLVHSTAHSPSVRVSAPIRPTLVKTVPFKTTSTTAAAAPTVRTVPTVSAVTSKNVTPMGTKNNFISKSPMLAGIGKQQVLSNQAKAALKDKDKKTSVAAVAAAAAAAATHVTALAGGYVGDDDVNDVAAMAGVNLAEETQRILGPSEYVGTQIRSCKDETFLHTHQLTMRIIDIASKHGLDDPSSDIVALVSHAAQERLKNILEKLNVIAEHRVDFNKADKNYEISHDIRGQLRCLEELDKVERKRHDEMERELLLRAAKSRSKSEDPEQVKLKAKAKELQRAEMEELRQREANLTALQAIGPRKKIKLEPTDGQSFGFSSTSSLSSSANRLSLANRPRLKRVTVRDFLYVMEKEKHMNRSAFLYKSYLK